MKSVRTIVVMGGKALAAATSAAQWAPDFRKIRAHYGHESFSLVRAYYGIVIPHESPESLARLSLWLEYNGFTVSSRQAKGEYHAQFLFVRVAVDLMMKAIAALEGGVNNVILFANAEYYEPFVQYLKMRGVRVTIVSDKELCDDSLRRAADDFVELKTMRAQFELVRSS